MEVVKLDQRPGGVHARRRVHPRPVRRPRLLGRRRLLRARARRGGRHGAARRRVDRRRHAVARRLAHGLAPVRRGVPLARVHARAHARGLRDLLRREVPGPRARRPGGRSASPPAYARLLRARRRVRREVGLGARELVRAQRRATATSRSGRAAGRASTGHPRSAPSTGPAARRRRSSTSRRSRSSTSRARAPPRSSSACARTASRGRSGRSRTRRC